MKKIYSTPSTEVIIISAQHQLLGGSPDPQFDPNASTSTMDSRRGGSFFDDDDDWD